MRSLIDDHALDIMLDLTGERRAVPEMGIGGPAEPAGSETRVGSGDAASGPAAQSHAGACEARLLRQRLAMEDLALMAGEELAVEVTNGGGTA